MAACSSNCSRSRIEKSVSNVRMVHVMIGSSHAVQTLLTGTIVSFPTVANRCANSICIAFSLLNFLKALGDGVWSISVIYAE